MQIQRQRATAFLACVGLCLTVAACSPPGAAIQGRAVNALSGKPAAGAKMVAETYTDIAQEKTRAKFSTTAGSDGSFSVRGLIPDRDYDVVVAGGDYMSRSISVRTPAKGQTRVMEQPIVVVPRPPNGTALWTGSSFVPLATTRREIQTLEGIVHSPYGEVLSVILPESLQGLPICSSRVVLASTQGELALGRVNHYRKQVVFNRGWYDLKGPGRWYESDHRPLDEMWVVAGILDPSMGAWGGLHLRIYGSFVTPTRTIFREGGVLIQDFDLAPGCYGLFDAEWRPTQPPQAGEFFRVGPVAADTGRLIPNKLHGYGRGGIESRAVE